MTKICTKCLIPESYPGTTFNAEGICNHCSNYKYVKPAGKQALLSILNSRRGREYDCVIGISGGKDSCYVAYLSKTELNLRALAVCYDFPFLVELAKENIKKVCDSLQLDVIYVKSKNNLEYSYERNHLISLSGTQTTWGQCLFCHYGIAAILANIAKERDIPFILSGVTKNELWNPGNRTQFLLKRLKKLPVGELLNFIYFQSKAYLNLVDQRMQFGVPGNNRFDVYRRAKMQVGDIEIINFYDYIQWDQELIEKTLTEHTGWKKPQKATSWRYDCILEPLLDYTYLKEFGISTVGLYLSGLIRAGLMKREEALLIQQKSERREELEKSLKFVLDFLKIPKKIQGKFFGN